MAFEIPITNEPNQSFSVSISLAETNVVLSFFVRFNTITDYWEASITDAATQTLLITGLPLLPAGNLIEQFSYLGIGKAYVTPLTDEAPPAPIVGSWGKDYALVWDE